MGDSAFGAVLRTLRERRGLSLRELGTLADIDYGYISKIERGDKEVPPEDTFLRLSRSLKPASNELVLLKFLYATPNIDPALALHALSDSDITPELLTIAASTVYRGTTRPAPEELIRRAKRAKEIMDGND